MKITYILAKNSTKNCCHQSYPFWLKYAPNRGPEGKGEGREGEEPPWPFGMGPQCLNPALVPLTIWCVIMFNAGGQITQTSRSERGQKHFPRDAVFLYLVEGLQWNLPQMIVMWLDIAEKVIKFMESKVIYHDHRPVELQTLSIFATD